MDQTEELQDAQFSIQHLMIGTVVCAVLLALVESPFSILAVVVLVYAGKWVGLSIGASKRERVYLHFTICFITYLYLAAIFFANSDKLVSNFGLDTSVVSPFWIILFSINILYFVPTFFLLMDLGVDLCLNDSWVFLVRSICEIVFIWPMWALANFTIFICTFGDIFNQF